MDIYINESNAARRTIDLALANTADGSPYTGAAPGVGEAKVKKAGGSEANHAGTFTHIGGGHWEYTFHAGEVDTNGKLSLRINKSGVYGDVYSHQVVSYNPHSASSLGLSNLDAAISTRSTLTAATLLDLENGIETGLTPRQALRLIASVIAGLTTGAGTNTEVFRASKSNSKPRATYTITGANRTAVTLDLD